MLILTFLDHGSSTNICTRTLKEYLFEYILYNDQHLMRWSIFNSIRANDIHGADQAGVWLTLPWSFSFCCLLLLP